MNILTFTTLFPNALQPNSAIFIYNRMAALKRIYPVDIKVVAPVPFFPPVKFFKNWHPFSQIPKRETIGPFSVWHPRYIVTPKIGMSFYWLTMFLGSLPLVKRFHEESPFDLIDAHYVYPDGLAAVCLGKILKIPVVVSARGTDIHLYSTLPVVKNLIRCVLKNARNIISVCDSLKSIMVKSGTDERKVFVIPNGIDRRRFYKIKRSMARSRVGVQENGKMLLTAGSLIKLKGHHILIDALFELNKQNQLDITTYIVGKGEEKENLHLQIRKYELDGKVCLVGEVPNKDLVNWYNAADIFFLGSSREGLPNVVMEALACGTPVVATSANGIPEIIKSEDHGLIVERNPKAFAAGILSAFSKNWNFEEIHAYGQSRTWESVAAEVYEIFERTL